MNEEAVSIFVVCESPRDQQTACELADRILCDEIDWLDQSIIESIRGWRGFDPEASHLTWTGAKALAIEKKIRVHGHFQGQPGKPDAVLLIRDSDNDTSRVEGLRQARNDSSLRRIIMGVAHTKRECWVLNGFVAENDDETAAINRLRQDLGFTRRQMHTG